MIANLCKAPDGSVVTALIVVTGHIKLKRHLGECQWTFSALYDNNFDKSLICFQKILSVGVVVIVNKKNKHKH